MSRDDEYRGADTGDIIRFLTAGFGMGLLVGAALGVLLAPKSGQETREQLKEFASEMGVRARDAAATIGDKATTTYGHASEQARTVVGTVGDKARKVGGTITETATTVREVTGKVTQAAREGYKKTMEELKSEKPGSETE